MESAVANPVATNPNTGRETRRRKKKMKTHHISNPNEKTAWKTETTQQLYSSKLLQALRHIRLSSPPSTAAPRRGRAVREAADRVLAAAARGRTRWSRALLSSRLKLKFINKKHKRSRRPVVAGAGRLQRKPRLEILKLRGKGVSCVQRKVKTLGQLVPGCRKEPLPVILEEATDYIPALEMQIRAMREILSRFSAAAGAGGAGGVGDNEVSSSSPGEPVSDMSVSDTGSD